MDHAVYPTSQARCQNEVSAIAAGYSIAMTADCSQHTFELLVKPDTDLDSRFDAYDRDAGEVLMLNGWMFDITRDDHPAGKGSRHD